ncbi:MAG: proton-conducting transporter membrane subunit [Spirochaetota bacterium]
MPLPILLVAIPVCFGLLVLILPSGRLSKSFLVAGTLAQAAGALALALTWWGGGRVGITFELPFQEYGILGLELVLAAFFAVSAARSKRLLPLLLAIAQAGIALVGETWTSGIRVETSWVIDELGIAMVLIIGIVGGLIVLYSLGYMDRHHGAHPELKDRRRLFGSVFLVFLGAMYGLVLANDLRLVLLFWELTTWASFVLIGYNRDAISIKNAFLALTLNLVGGISFSIGNILLAGTAGTLELSALGDLGVVVAALPVACLALAGLVKSAQFPFTPWLLGAMVAPTPVSALLHSSTMVKAGVFLLLRLAPALMGRLTGDLVALVGIVTFLLASFMAVSSRNAKRVLALSTVSNLGLIVVCAGIGTPQLLWAAFFLVIFHAIAKALLFLGVGTASLGTGSLDIEDMGGLLVSMPRLAILLVIGIAGMFVAPFGMLISKWTAMEAFVSMDSILAPVMIACLAWGSASTVFFWTKWIGTILRVTDPKAKRGALEKGTTRTEAFTETSLALLAVASFGAFPLVSSFLVEPWLHEAFGKAAFSPSSDNILTTLLMVAMTVFLPAMLLGIAHIRTKRLSTAYMSGRPTGPGLVYKGSGGVQKTVELRAMYLENFFPGGKLLVAGIALTILILLIMFGMVLS